MLVDKFIDIVLEEDFNYITDPKTAEDYQRLHYYQRFFLQLKWAKQEEQGVTDASEVLARYNKQLIKVIFKIIDEKINTVKTFKDDESIVKELKITKNELVYLKRYSGKSIKSTKYPKLSSLQLIELKLVLNGDDYVILSQSI